MVRAKRLRIAIVSTNSARATGGLEAYTRCLAQGLAKRHDVKAVARFGAAGGRGLDYAAYEPPQVLHDGDVETQLIAPLPAWRPLLKRLHHLTARRGAQTLALQIFKRAYGPSLSLALPDELDILHSVGTGWELLGFAVLAEARRRGAAFTVLPAVHPGTWGDGSLDIRLYRQADAVLALSRFEAEHLVQRGVPSSRLHVTGLAPAAEQKGDGARFRQRHHLAERPLVAFIGRKVKSKGYHELRRAMNYVLQTVPDACLVVVGADGEMPYPVLPVGAMLDLGRAGEDDKAGALAACDVFCMPSSTDSFGIVYVEAWSYGKPVVGGPSPAVRELITNDVNGFCVEQKSEDIAAILVQLLRDAALRARLGQAGRGLQQSRYTWDAVVTAHHEIFSRAIERCQEKDRDCYEQHTK